MREQDERYPMPTTPVMAWAMLKKAANHLEREAQQCVPRGERQLALYAAVRLLDRAHTAIMDAERVDYEAYRRQLKEAEKETAA